jgi:hypothetical protein
MGLQIKYQNSLLNVTIAIILGNVKFELLNATFESSNHVFYLL